MYRVLFIVTTIAFALFVAFMPVKKASAASLIAQAGSTTVVLIAEPCTSEKVKKSHPDVDLKKHGTARVTYQGRFIEACWIVNQESGTVDIVDAEGDQGSVPVAIFRPVDPI